MTQSFPYPNLSIISVVDKNGRHVSGLANKERWLHPGDFADNGQAIRQIWQPIRETQPNVSSTPEQADLYNHAPAPRLVEICETCEPSVPTSISLLMDMSSSLRDDHLLLAKQGLITFVNRMRDEDRAGVIQFAEVDSLFPTLPMTNNKQEIIDFINSATTRDWTPLYRALRQGIAQVKAETNARRCLVIYTDGRNALPPSEPNVFTPDSVIVNAQKNHIPIFTIALGKNTNEVVLKRIARQTGGRFFKTVDGSEFEAIYSQISEIIRNYYVLAYTSPNPCAPDSLRTLDVTVNTAGGTAHGQLDYFYSGRPKDYDLAVELTSSVATENLCIGDEVTYTIALRNLGPNTAFDFSLTHNLSRYLTATEYSLAPLQNGPDSAFWGFDSLAAFGERLITITARVAQDAPNELTEMITETQVKASCDVNSANDLATDTVIYDPAQCLPNLSIGLLSRTDSLAVQDGDSLQFAKQGEVYPYSINVRNESRFYATDVQVHNVLPDSVKATDHEGRIVTWSLGDVAPFRDTTLALSVRVADFMPEGINLLVDSVAVHASNEDPEQLSDNSAVDTVYNYVEPRLSDLSVRLSARPDSFSVVGGDTLWFAKAGETYNYSIDLSNRSKYAAHDVRLFQALPDSVRSGSIAANDTIRWHLGTLPAFGDTTIVVEASLPKLMPEGTSLLVSRVFARAENEDPQKLANNSDENRVFVYVEPRLSDIIVSLRVETDSLTSEGSDTLWFARAGETFPYFINVRNQAKYAAERVILKGTFPSQITAEDSNNGHLTEWHLGDLAPFSETTLSVRAVLATELSSQILELVTTVEGQADNENPDKLFDNAASSSVFTVPPTEGCDLFHLDVNIYRPDEGHPLGINFELNSSRAVRLDLYDLSGYHVTKLVEAPFTTGENRFEWDGTTATGQKVGSGVYVITLKSGNLVCWKKVILAR